MSNPVAFAEPMSLVLRDTLCDYCHAQSDRTIVADHRLFGIKCCTEHIPLGKRDVNAWLHAHNIVRQRDFLAIHPDLENVKINVPRSDGSVTTGGNLSTEPYSFLGMHEGHWNFEVVFTDPKTTAIMSKRINVVELVNSGIPEEMVQTWIRTLDSLYKEDFEANAAAVKLGTQKTDREHESVRTVYVNGIECRVCIP